MKRRRSGWIVLCLVAVFLAAAPMLAKADSSGYYTYEVTNGKATITYVDPSISADITVPSNLGGYPVTTIADHAFVGCSQLTGVTIPSGIITIGDHAFADCTKLKTVSISDSVTNIGNNIFGGCTSLSGIWVNTANPSYSSDSRGVLFDKEKLVLYRAPEAISNSYTIPSGVRYINKDAFFGCGKLTAVTIPTGVTYIGEGAFYHCESLASINIPSGVTGIEAYAFCGCTALKSISIPNSVQSIGEFAFYRCSNLSRLTIGSGVTWIGGAAFYECISLSSVSIPNSVKYIWEYAFSGCSNMTTLTIGSGVTLLDEYAFSWCSALKNVNIPANVTQVGAYAFYECTGLTGATVGADVGDYMFYGCTGLTNVTIGSAVTRIGENAFSGCSKLQSVVIPNRVVEIGDSAFYNCIKLSKVTMGSGVTSIEDAAFCGCESLTAITVPDSVTSMGQMVFFGCTSLTKATIGNGVVKIPESAFSTCGNLQQVILGSAVAEIEDYAFYDCSSLTDINIPNGVTTIGDFAFFRCGDLANISLPEGVTHIGESAFNRCGSLTNISIPDSITSVGVDAFYDCNKLQTKVYEKAKYLGNSRNPYVYLLEYEYQEIGSCTIHPNARIIGEEAFWSCYNLTEITIPENIVQISPDAFTYCNSLTGIWVDADNAYYCSDSAGVLYNKDKTELLQAPGTIKGDYDIPDSVVTIHMHAFDSCSELTRIYIPESVCSIGRSSFVSCPNLTGIWVDTDNAYYCSDAHGVLFDKAKKVLLQAPGALAGAYAVPYSVTDIRFFAFDCCDGLTAITIMNQVTNMGDYVFSNCSGLTTVSIPNSVTAIPNGAFFNCKQLNQIVIPDSVESIGEYAFFWCDNFQTVYYTGTQAQWRNIAIEEGGNEALLNANVVFGYKPQIPDHGSVENWNLILKEDIGVNFQMVFSDAIMADDKAYVEVEVAGQITEIPVSSAIGGLLVNVAPAQMTEEIGLCIVSGNGIRGQTFAYSVKAYADEILSGNYSNSTKQLVRYMLNYGAMAQTYFDYNENTLANEGVASEMAAVPQIAPSAISISGNLEGVTFRGASLRYDHKLALRYYFETDDIRDFTFTVNGAALQAEQKDDLYFVEISQIVPQDIGNTFSMRVEDAGGRSMTVTYSPMNYIVRMYHNENTTPDGKNLLQALYTYYLAAKSYTP